MPLNKEGIEQLKADLRANAQHYAQNKFGNITSECGTECCIAGMCYMQKIGLPQFAELVKQLKIDDQLMSWMLFDNFMEKCLTAASDQIGLEILDKNDYHKTEGLPPIFASSESWPVDLHNKYSIAEKKHDHVAMAEVACEALDRIDANGIFIER